MSVFALMCQWSQADWPPASCSQLDAARTKKALEMFPVVQNSFVSSSLLRKFGEFCPFFVSVHKAIMNNRKEKLNLRNIDKVGVL